MFGLSPAQMIILLVVILLVFGTKKLRNAGSDLGAAVKALKKRCLMMSRKKMLSLLKLKTVQPPLKKLKL